MRKINKQMIYLGFVFLILITILISGTPKDLSDDRDRVNLKEILKVISRDYVVGIYYYNRLYDDDTSVVYIQSPSNKSLFVLFDSDKEIRTTYQGSDIDMENMNRSYYINNKRYESLYDKKTKVVYLMTDDKSLFTLYNSDGKPVDMDEFANRNIKEIEATGKTCVIGVSEYEVLHDKGRDVVYLQSLDGSLTFLYNLDREPMSLDEFYNCKIERVRKRAILGNYEYTIFYDVISNIVYFQSLDRSLSVLYNSNGEPMSLDEYLKYL